MPTALYACGRAPLRTRADSAQRFVICGAGGLGDTIGCACIRLVSTWCRSTAASRSKRRFLFLLILHLPCCRHDKARIADGRLHLAMIWPLAHLGFWLEDALATPNSEELRARLASLLDPVPDDGQGYPRIAIKDLAGLCDPGRIEAPYVVAVRDARGNDDECRVNQWLDEPNPAFDGKCPRIFLIPGRRRDSTTATRGCHRCP